MLANGKTAMEGCDSPDFEETCSSAVLICAIVWNLSAGAFRRQCITTRARSGGASRTSGSLYRIAAIVESKFSPLKARRPLSNS